MTCIHKKPIQAHAGELDNIIVLAQITYIDCTAGQASDSRLPNRKDKHILHTVIAPACLRRAHATKLAERACTPYIKVHVSPYTADQTRPPAHQSTEKYTT